MPKKPIKRGFKIWCCSDANSGYLQEFQIYTGKEQVLHKSEIGIVHSVVSHLLGPLAGKTHVHNNYHKISSACMFYYR